MRMVRLALILSLVAGTFEVIGRAQTPVTLPKNNHEIELDTKIHDLVRQKIHSRVPIIINDRITIYLGTLTKRLQDGLPLEFNRKEFAFRFYITDFDGFGVFAFPGGTIYITRGSVERVAGEGELLALMAHGMSHVALRQYTARLPETEKINWDSLETNLLSTFYYGVPGHVDNRRFRNGVYLLRFDETAEREADILAAQILARAKGDPHDLGNVYQRIGYGFDFDQDGTSYCPSSRNPYALKKRLYAEAELLRSAGLYDPHKVSFMSPDFRPIQKMLADMPRRKGQFIFQK